MFTARLLTVCFATCNKKDAMYSVHEFKLLRIILVGVEEKEMGKSSLILTYVYFEV